MQASTLRLPPAKLKKIPLATAAEIALVKAALTRRWNVGFRILRGQIRSTKYSYWLQHLSGGGLGHRPHYSALGQRSS
jgi:hypothetical protein